MIRAFATAAFLVLLAAAAPVAGQSVDPQEAARRQPRAETPTTLYFHINGFQDFPINTQKPDDRYAPPGSTVGSFTNSNGCVRDPTGQAGLVSQEYHTFYGYLSPSYVQYDIIENGKPRIHQERGISADVELAGDFELVWYLETQVASADMTPDINGLPAPVVLPNVVVRASMRAGDAVSVGNQAYEDGPLLAEGHSGPHLLAGENTNAVRSSEPEGTVTYIPLANGHHLYEFRLPMRLSQPVIPQEDGANLRVDVLLDNPACDGPGYLMPNSVRVHTSPEHRPRMQLAVRNPLMIPMLHPQFVAGDLVIHAAANSPWGNYDVDEGDLRLTIEGPSVARSLERHRSEDLDRLVKGHNGHHLDLPVVYLWDHEADGAKDGIYTVTFRIRNDQGTAEAVATARFQVGKDQGMCGEDGLVCAPAGEREEAPGPGAALLLLAAGALAAKRRRQDRSQ